MGVSLTGISNISLWLPVPSTLAQSAVGSVPGFQISTLFGYCTNWPEPGAYAANFTYYNTSTNANIINVVTPYITNLSNITMHSGTQNCAVTLCRIPQTASAMGVASNSVNCMNMQINNALNQAQTNYNNYIAQITDEFLQAYKNHCYANVTEEFERGFFLNEYQYTLYYYDLSGNLVHTVPPASVQVLSGTNLNNAVSFAYSGGLSGSPVYPNHSLNQNSGINSYVSHYAYNTYNSPLRQVSPDAGESIYFYDYLGRIVASRNSKQAYDTTYSYVLYDTLGRITEAGVIGNITTALSSTITRNPNMWKNYLVGLSKTEVVSTYYDKALNTTVTGFFPNGQTHLIDRVSASTYEEVFDNNPNTYDHGTFYSYDDHGNVYYLIQDKTNAYRKTVEYTYDLFSGNVKGVVYNRGFVDQFFHQYVYDADNRLKEVLTSQNGETFQKDAKYFYYYHGPLARTELGEKQVQAIDYAYTILGWIKGINSNILEPSLDIGKDGDAGSSYISSQGGIHQSFAKDAASYNLNYFVGDYTAIKSGAGTWLANKQFLSFNNGFIRIPFSSVGANSASTYDGPDLYNGNISSMVTSIYDMNPLSEDLGLPKPQVTAYKYDQLHRIKHMKAYSSMNIASTNAAKHSEAIDISLNQWNLPVNGNYKGMYEMDFSYDKLGNLLNLERKGDAEFTTAWATKDMDDLTYHYQTSANKVTSIGTINKNNQLLYVDDDLAIPSANYADDIEDQNSGNYAYNPNGSLTQDLGEQIQTITWTATNRIKSLVRTNGSLKPDLEFEYDVSGRRTCKRIIYKTAVGNIDPDHLLETFYYYDASGHVLAVYDKEFIAGATSTITTNTCKELDVYGSNRHGVLDQEIDMSGSLNNQEYAILFGTKSYEIANHLSNVLTTLSDRKFAIDGEYQFVGNASGSYNFDGLVYNNVGAGNGVFNQISGQDGFVDSYFANINSTTDYYAFGQGMPGRTWIGGDQYRYTHNGHEREDEIFNYAQSAEFWMYDSRIGRRWEKDPVIKPWESPYAAFSNNPIYFADPLGLDSKDAGEAARGGKDGAGTKYSEDNNKRTNGSSSETFNNDCKCYILDGIAEASDTPAENGSSSLSSATTANGPANGQAQPDPSTPGGYTSEGVRIVAAPGSKQDLYKNHNFSGDFSVEVNGLQYDNRKADVNISISPYKFKTKIKNVPKVEPKIVLGQEGIQGAGLNELTITGEEYDIAGWFGQSISIKQFAIIHKQKMNISADNFYGKKTALSVETATTILTYNLKQQYAGILNSNQLIITAQTWFNTIYGKQAAAQIQLADTAYRTGNVSVSIVVPGTPLYFKIQNK